MSSSNLPQYPIPRIEVFSIPNRDNLIKIGRRFYCNFPLCRNTPIASYHFYDIHCYTRHICELCHNCFENLANHICSVPREQIGGSARLPASLPANINLHPFTVIANAQKGTVLTLKMDFDRLVENFTDAIDSIYPELER